MQEPEIDDMVYNDIQELPTALAKSKYDYRFHRFENEYYEMIFDSELSRITITNKKDGVVIGYSRLENTFNVNSIIQIIWAGLCTNTDTFAARYEIESFVSHVDTIEREIKFKSPLIVNITKKGPYYEAKHDMLEASGNSLETVKKNIDKELDVVFRNYACDYDANLSKKGRELKNWMLGLIETGAINHLITKESDNE